MCQYLMVLSVGSWLGLLLQSGQLAIPAWEGVKAFKKFGADESLLMGIPQHPWLCQIQKLLCMFQRHQTVAVVVISFGPSRSNAISTKHIWKTRMRLYFYLFPQFTYKNWKRIELLKGTTVLKNSRRLQWFSTSMMQTMCCWLEFWL